MDIDSKRSTSVEVPDSKLFVNSINVWTILQLSVIASDLCVPLTLYFYDIGSYTAKYIYTQQKFSVRHCVYFLGIKKVKLLIYSAQNLI